jgi:hypothetical protein
MQLFVQAGLFQCPIKYFFFNLEAKNSTPPPSPGPHLVPNPLNGPLWWGQVTGRGQLLQMILATWRGGGGGVEGGLPLLAEPYTGGKSALCI